MKVVFLGVGDAVDERLGNTSLLLSSETKLLLDCGYAVPHQLWRHADDQEFLDGVWLSHAHGDHYLGFPALLLRMKIEQRKKPLTLFCPKGVAKKVAELIQLSYPGNLDDPGFPVEYREVAPGEKVAFNEFSFSFAPTKHFLENLAIRIDVGEKSLCYSGDGELTPEEEELCNDVDLLIHEAYLFEKEMANHESIPKLLEMLKRTKVKSLALTHINRVVRREDLARIKEAAGPNVLIPEPFDEFELRC